MDIEQTASANYKSIVVARTERAIEFTFHHPDRMNAPLGDFIVAGESVQFGFPEARYGLMPGAGGTQNLLRVVGRARAKEFMTGRRLSAAEGKDLRIVKDIVALGRPRPR